MEILADHYWPTVEKAKALLDAHDPAGADPVITDGLHEWPQSLELMFLFGRMLRETDHAGAALNVFRDLMNRDQRWQFKASYANCLSQLDKPEKALDALEGCPENAHTLCAVSTAWINLGDYDKAIHFARRALADGYMRQPYINMAFAYLHKGNDALGYDYYRHGMGNMTWREERNYIGEPEWQGEDCRLLVYGEQGIGDQIVWLRNMAKQTTVLDVHPKMQRLYARNFPDIEVHGDFRNWDVDWTPEIDASVSVSAMQCHVDQPCGPYLTADPDKELMWSALLDDKGIRVGLCWTGGKLRSASSGRKAHRLEHFAPIYEQMPVVSLEYRNPGELPENIHHWCETEGDLEDIAAIIASLDVVVGVGTTAMHLAGALGVPALILNHDRPHFHYRGEGSPYWDTWRRFDTVEDMVGELMKLDRAA